MTIKKTDFKIQIIDATQTFKVRHPILRAGKSIETCRFVGDELETTFHFGIFTKNELVGVCSFLQNNHQSINKNKQYQLRGMAILKAYQGKGLGSIILSHGETFLKKRNTLALWCNAREVAVNFYERNGYQKFGNPFNIDDIGLHYLMYKNIK